MPVWFNIKKSKHFTDGPKHVFQAIQTSRYLSDDLLKIVNPVIQRNAFFAHPENLLLAMIVDDRENIRKLGYRRILKARKCASKEKTIRNFVLPKINFKATDYTEIIDWCTCPLYSPPILQGVSDDEIKLLINSDTRPIRDIKEFPCHTQVVERYVKLVTDASSKVCGYEARDGYIRSLRYFQDLLCLVFLKSQILTCLY